MTISKETKKTSFQLRQSKVRELLKDGQNVSIPELADLFKVSEMTIHRDLRKLESQGQIKRMRGGALVAERMAFEFNFTSRRRANHKAKQAIAAEAFKMIHAGQRIILDTGTTTLELAYLLKNCRDLTVITPSLAVASVLQFSQEVQTVLLGGIIRKSSPDLTGVVTETVLDMFSVDIAFQGADGIGMDGTLYNADMRIAKVDQKIRQRAEKTYILCDSSKIGKTALATNGKVYEIDALITDNNIKKEEKEVFEESGATVITVEDTLKA